MKKIILITILILFLSVVSAEPISEPHSVDATEDYLVFNAIWKESKSLTDDIFGIYYQDRKTGKNYRITSTSERNYPRISGTNIAFTKTFRAVQGGTHRDMMVYSIEKNELKRISFTTANEHQSIRETKDIFDIDGDYVVYSVLNLTHDSPGVENYDLYVYQISTGETKNITRYPSVKPQFGYVVISNNNVYFLNTKEDFVTSYNLQSGQLNQIASPGNVYEIWAYGNEVCWSVDTESLYCGSSPTVKQVLPGPGPESTPEVMYGPYGFIYATYLGDSPGIYYQDKKIPGRFSELAPSGLPVAVEFQKREIVDSSGTVLVPNKGSEATSLASQLEGNAPVTEKDAYSIKDIEKKYDLENIEEVKTNNIRISDSKSAKVSVGDQEYLVYLSQASNGSASISVTGSSQRFITLNQNQTQTIDLDGDDSPDMEITLNSSSKNQADIDVTSIKIKKFNYQEEKSSSGGCGLLYLGFLAIGAIGFFLRKP